MSAPIEVRQNEQEHRFEAAVEGGLALVSYRRQGDQITFIHTEVPDESEGKGVASTLVKTAMDYARSQKLRVIAQCPYVAGWVKRHMDAYGDLLGS